MASALLLLCACGRYSHALAQHFCAPCQQLRCAHPQCTAEAPDALACPACARRWPASHAAALQGACPACQDASAPLLPPAPPAPSASAEAFCLALSRSPALASLLPQPAAQAQRRALLLPAAGGGGAAAAAAALGSHLVAPQLAAGAAAAAAAAATSTAAPPLRRRGVQLLPLLTRRCRACLARGLPGILTSPTPPSAPGEPLAGSGGGGGGAQPAPRLFRKLSAAAAVVPWLSLAPRGALSAVAAAPPPPATPLAAAALRQLLHAAAAAAAAQGAPAAALPLTLHIANPLEHACALALHAVPPPPSLPPAPPPAPSPARSDVGLGGQGCAWVQGQLDLGEAAAAAAPLQWALLGARDDLAEGAAGAPTAAEAAAAAAAFPWPPGAAAAAAAAAPAPAPPAPLRILGSTAQCEVTLRVPLAGALAGAPVEAPLELTLLLPPSASAELLGLARPQGDSARASPVRLRYLLQIA